MGGAMVMTFGCPVASRTKQPLYVAVVDLACNLAYSVDQAALEGVGGSAAVASLRPEEV